MTNAPGQNMTTLHRRHLDLGGNMVDFGGWDMPLWYVSGAVKEHLAVVGAAGLFDTGHMSVIMGQGARVRDFLNFALTRDIAALKPERAGYSIILDEQGGAVDDTIAYPLAEDRIALVVNAAMAGPVIRHFSALPGADQVAWTDLTGRLAKLDIQGPAAFGIFRQFVDQPDQVFAKFPYFSFKGDFDLARSAMKLKDGTPILLSRSGYTGEQGFEIFLDPAKAPQLWDALLEAGRPAGLIPCGLAARDSLRTGAVLPLSHQDIGPWPYVNNPWPWALPLNPDGGFSKDFFGAKALNPATADYTRPFVGYDPRKVDTHQARVMYQGQDIGRPLTCVADMAIGRLEDRVLCLTSPDRPVGWTPRGLVCGFVKIDRPLPDGTVLTLKDGRRELPVELVSDIRPERTARKALR